MSEDAGRSPPDTLFALIFGLYLGVGAGTVAVAGARRAFRDPGVLYALLLAVVAVVTVGGTIAARRVPGLAVRLGRGRLGWAVPALPGFPRPSPPSFTASACSPSRRVTPSWHCSAAGRRSSSGWSSAPWPSPGG